MPIGNPIRKQNESRMVSVLATSGQTVFTVQGGYRINQISVFRNGVRLSPADDYTAGDGSTVTLNDGANVNDRIDFHIFDTFTVQNAIIGAASTQTINGDLVLNGKLFGQLDVPSINLTGIITATELDLNGKGDISGDLKVTGISTFTNVDAAGIVTARQGLRINANGLNVTGVSTFQDIEAANATISNDVSIADKIVHTGDGNTAIRFPSADTISFETAGTEGLRVDSSGNLKMPAGAFDLRVGDDTNSNAGTQTISVGSTSSGSGGIGIFANPTNGNSFVQFGDGTSSAEQYRGYMNYQHASDSLIFGTAGSERIRVDSSGRILQGSSTGRNTALMAAQATYQLEGVGSNASNFSIFCNSNGTAAGGIEFGKTRGTSNGGTTIVASGDDLGHISFEGSDGSAQRVAARINVQVDGTPGSSDMPGRIRFLTTPDGSASEVERMRIDSAGRVSIGDNNAQTVYPFYVAKDLNSGGNLLSFGNTDSTYSQGLTLSFDSNKDMKWAGGSGTGGLIWDVGTRGFSFQIGSSEKLKVTSAGNLGVGYATPSQRLVVYAGSDNSDVAVFTGGDVSRGLKITTSAASGPVNDAVVTFNAQTSSVGEIALATVGTEGLRVTSAQNVNIAGQGSAFGRLNIPVSTQSGGAAIQAMNTSGGSGDGTTTNIVLRSVNSTGTQWAHSEYRSQSHKFQVQTTNKVTINSNGLCFDSNTAAANALDAYEEGTFTPRLRAHDSLTGAVNGGGRYTRIGNRVWIHISINGQVTTSIPNGAVIRIDQLPYAAVGDSAAYETTNTWMPYGITMRESTTFYTENGAAYITGIYATSAGQWVNTTTNDFNQGTIYLNFNMNYRIG